MDSYEIAQKAETAMKALSYPKHPAKPYRAQFTDAKQFGMALHIYETITFPVFRTTKKQYSERISEITNQFEHDLAESNGLIDHPNRNKLWEFAWSEGHSSGLNEVANYYDRFAELLK